MAMTKGAELVWGTASRAERQQAFIDRWRSAGLGDSGPTIPRVLSARGGVLGLTADLDPIELFTLLFSRTYS
jgi:hypothetical protein